MFFLSVVTADGLSWIVILWLNKILLLPVELCCELTLT